MSVFVVRQTDVNAPGLTNLGRIVSYSTKRWIFYSFSGALSEESPLVRQQKKVVNYWKSFPLIPNSIDFSFSWNVVLVWVIVIWMTSSFSETWVARAQSFHERRILGAKRRYLGVFRRLFLVTATEELVP